MGRTKCCAKTGLRKGAWTPEEDRMLRAYVSQFGCWNWRQLPKYAGLKRCGKSCRLRWMNYLRPNIKRGNYSKEEEDTIIKLHETLGNRWSAIAAQLPGRTDNEIKNHWHTYLKKRLQQNYSTTCEAKPKSNDLSQSEISQEGQLEPNDSLQNPTATHQIPESFPLMSPQLSLGELSRTTDSPALNSCTNWVTGDKATPLETITEDLLDFWTEPFLADNSYMQNDFAEPMVDDGFLFSCGLYYEPDGVTWENILMEGLPYC